MMLQAHAPDRDMRAGLLLFAGPGVHTSLPGVAAVTLKSKTSFTIAALLLLTWGAFWCWPDTQEKAAREQPAVATTALAEPPPPPSAAVLVRTEVTPAVTPTPSRMLRPSWTAQVTGRVVDAWRHPVAGASVVAELDGGARAETQSDAAGKFALALPVAQAWVCKGELLATQGKLAGTVPFARWTTTTENTENDVGTVVLTATGELRVQVCRGAAPIANARVVAVRAVYAPGLRYETVSRDDGTAVLQGLPPGRYCLGATAADGSWVVGHADAIAERATTRTLDLLASTPVSVEVRARGSELPIADAQVEALYVVDQENLPAKIPLRLLVPLPRTDAGGRARVTGLCRGQIVSVGAEHADWRPMLVWNASPIDWGKAPALAEVRLDSLATVTWQLCDGEVPLPPDGTMFHILETQVALRDGSLHFDGQPLGCGPGWDVTAFGPGCYAVLPVASSIDGAAHPVPLQRTRRLEVELRDTRGQPLVGWPLSLSAGQKGQTGADGRAIFPTLPSGSVYVYVTSSGGPPMKDLGVVDLRRGDGVLTGTFEPARRVRAQVHVNGRPGLPGALVLHAIDGRVENVVEDVDRGVLTFDLWQSNPDGPGQLLLYSMPSLSVGKATLAPGTGPADIEFRLDSTASATVALMLPADGRCQVRVERFFVQGTGGFWSFAGTVSSNNPRRLDSLVRGRYRLHDTDSEVLGPEVEVLADGTDAQLTLDLSKVTAARGSVLASPPFTDIHIEVRTQAGAVRQRMDVFNDGTFAIRASLDEPGLVLVAVRGAVRSAPVPWSGAMQDISLVLPR